MKPEVEFTHELVGGPLDGKRLKLHAHQSSIVYVSTSSRRYRYVYQEGTNGRDYLVLESVA